LKLETTAPGVELFGQAGGPQPNQGWIEQPAAAGAKKRPAWVIPVVAVVGVIVLVAAAFGAVNLVGGGSGSNFTTLDVSLTVYSDDGCDLSLGFDDVPGSTVTVSVDGVPVAYDDLSYFGENGFIYCEFNVSIPDVPTDGNIYEIEIGRRGNAVMSNAELVADNWSYAASLGL
jgi:hypothetical protein